MRHLGKFIDKKDIATKEDIADNVGFYNAVADKFYKDREGELSSWSVKTWQGSSPIGDYVWEYNGEYYYSNGTTQKKLVGDTWENVTWEGLTNFTGNHIWVHDGIAYYSNSSNQYYLNSDGKTWVVKEWTKPSTTSLYGPYVWNKDGTIHYDYMGTHWYLDDTDGTWKTYAWSGTYNVDGQGIWKHNGDYYYSNSTASSQRKLVDNEWVLVDWGHTDLGGLNVWHALGRTYYSNGSKHLEFVDGNWVEKTWTGAVTTFLGSSIWEKGDVCYISPFTGTNYQNPFAYTYSNEIEAKEGYVYVDLSDPQNPVQYICYTKEDGTLGYKTATVTPAWGNITGKPFQTVGSGLEVEGGELQVDTDTIATKEDVDAKEDSDNKVTAWSSTTTNDNYPSEKLVKDSLDNKEDKITEIELTGTSGTLTAAQKELVVNNPRNVRFKIGAYIYHLCAENSTQLYFSNNQSDYERDFRIVKESGSWTQTSNALELTSHKKTAWSSTPSDTNYPSEKLVKNSLDNKADDIDNGSTNVDRETVIKLVRPGHMSTIKAYLTQAESPTGSAGAFHFIGYRFTEGAGWLIAARYTTDMWISKYSGGTFTDWVRIKPEIATAWNTTPSDEKVPSEKLVKDSLDNKLDKSTTADTDGWVTLTNPSNVTGTLKYKIYKGVCYVQAGDLAASTSGTKQFATPLPIPYGATSSFVIPMGNWQSKVCPVLYISWNSGVVQLHAESSNINVTSNCLISYPVE